MQGYPQINLKDLIEKFGRKQMEERLKLFSCPLNADVEDFIQNKAVNFALQDLAVYQNIKNKMADLKSRAARRKNALPSAKTADDTKFENQSSSELMPYIHKLIMEVK